MASGDYHDVSDREPVIGIDLGTTNSCVGVWDWKAESVNIATTDQGNRTVPSVVCFHKGEVLVGDAAKRKLTSHPLNTIYTSKRVIGRAYSHIREEDIEGWTFDLICTEDNRPRYKVSVDGEQKLISPEEIGALILAHLKSVAEAFIGREVTRVVITVPAYFTEPQRRATRDAGLLAGLDVVRLLPEPTAAALAFGLDRKIHQEGASYVLVFDMGGGTFDVSVLELDGKGSFVTKAVTGDFHLGGEDFDDLILKWVLQNPAFPQQGSPIPPKTRQKLRKLCEAAKRELSTGFEACIEFEYAGQEVQLDLTREMFEGLCQPLFDNAMVEVTAALSLAEIGQSDIDSIVLVGGSTRIPKIQDMLQGYFNGKELWRGVNPDEAVAWGATALAAAYASGRKQTTGATAPAQQSRAAVPLRNLTLTPVTPITLGIELSHGGMDVLIPRGSNIPAVRSEEYTTADKGQKTVVVTAYEGENTARAKSNSLLGKFTLPVEHADAGVPKSDGLFLVTAKDVMTGKEITVKLENSNLTNDEKDEIVAAVGSTRSRFRALISNVWGLSTESGDAELLEMCKESLEWLQSYPEASKEEIEHRCNRLQQAARSLGQ